MADETSKVTPGEAAPVPDPLTKQSLSFQTALWTGLLVVTTIWAFWDEGYTKRPWKSYQADFVQYYRKHLDRKLTEARANMNRLEQEDDDKQQYQQLKARWTQAESEAKNVVLGLRRRIATLEANIDSLQLLMKFPKAEIDALIYRLEVASEKAKGGYRREIERLGKKEEYSAWITDDAGKRQEKAFTFEAARAEWLRLKDERVTLQKRVAELLAPVAAIKKKLDKFVETRRDGLSPSALSAIKSSLDDWVVEIKQINVADVQLVDRCVTCHAGILEPVEISKRALFDVGLKGATEPWVDEASADRRQRSQFKEYADMRAMFSSHPRPGVDETRPDLLEIHDPQEFGCSPCHGGNGIATTTRELAHGLNKHWLWPLYDHENVHAGCNQCHEASLVLDGAEVLNRGKELFRHKGCWACHKREHFNAEVDRLRLLDVALRENQKAYELEDKQERQINRLLDETDDNDRIEYLNWRLDMIAQERAALVTERESMHKEQRDLFDQRKSPGPNLKEIRAKLRPEWIAGWIKNPRLFRPGTKMPVFRLDDEQVKAIAAFIWQRALDPEKLGLPFERHQPRGDPTKGRELFKSRGCMGCHSLDGRGGDFAADLSRVGEKINYDYLVRWIHDPGQRLAPYSPDAGRDLLPADFEKAGRSFTWSSEDAECPVSGGELVTHNMTVMPSLRLTWDEARDIGSYLMTRNTDASYPPAEFLEDKTLAARGEHLVKHFGCAACHEIAGLENEGGIGTELTKWGSKPIDRIDFGLLTHDFKAEGKYDHKHFAMAKLKRPEIWDDGKEKRPLDKLRMPNFGLSDEERNALTTFLIGSVDSRYPERFYYNPQGPEKDIVEGWWIVKKYNCMGCHQFRPDDRPRIQDLPQFSGENADFAPPSLVGEGYRAKPDWLAEFLRDPSLSGKNPAEAETHRNGVRSYLDVRMPSFRLTEEEIGKLVHFFNALSKQQLPYLEPADELLEAAEIAMVQPLMAKKCMECHVGGKPKPGKRIIAPSFMLSGGRLKPAWMRRWLLDPARFLPGTRMPTGLFTWRENEKRWVISGETPENMKDYEKDHVELFVRYMRQFPRFQ